MKNAIILLTLCLITTNGWAGKRPTVKSVNEKVEKLEERVSELESEQKQVEAYREKFDTDESFLDRYIDLENEVKAYAEKRNIGWKIMLPRVPTEQDVTDRINSFEAVKVCLKSLKDKFGFEPAESGAFEGIMLLNSAQDGYRDVKPWRVFKYNYLYALKDANANDCMKSLYFSHIRHQ